MKLFVGAFGVGALVVALSSCGGGGGASSITGGGGVSSNGGGTNGATCPANTVCMLFSAGGAYATGTGTFTPASLTVTQGSTISFTNNSGVAHNVVFDSQTQSPPGGDIGVISSGTQQRTFSTAGSFPFHCTVHEGMIGTITVQ